MKTLHLGFGFLAIFALACLGAPANAADSKTAPPAPRLSPDQRAELDRLNRDAIIRYRRGDIEGARAAWTKMLEIKPDDKRATTYLEETKKEHDLYPSKFKQDEAGLERSRAARRLLDSPVTISTDRPTPLAEFMRIISFSTPTEIEYSIAEGADAEVMANFVDRPLAEVLDAVINPAGLKWEINERGLVVIRPDLSTRVFKLAPDQARKTAALMENSELQRVIWGQAEPPAKGIQMTLDERTRTLTVVGSRLHLQKIEDFVATTAQAQPPDLETHIYKIRPEDGPKIKALINGLTPKGEASVLVAERKVFIDGADLIIRDTPEQIVKAEELLLDKNFIERLAGGELELANFSLVPRDVESPAPGDQLEVFTTRVVEAVETFLYARTGRRAAAATGRRLWFDPSTLQLTVVDTPQNIQVVGRFIESLPELRRKKLQQVAKLDYAVAEEMATQLNEMLGLAAADGSRGGADEVIKKLRRGDEFTFHDLRIRLIRVEAGDPNDRNDDECELQINTGTQVSNITMRELDTQFFEDCEIQAVDIQPAGGSGAAGGAGGGNRGEGSARIRVSYVEPVEETK